MGGGSVPQVIKEPNTNPLPRPLDFDLPFLFSLVV